MNAEQLQEFRKIRQWLFERCPENWEPQVGFADVTKRALGWFPGRRALSPGYQKKCERGAKFAGCTQVAFPVGTQTYKPEDLCYLCWLGIDIDAKNQTSPDWENKLFNLVVNSFWSERFSSNGQGAHLLLRLASPVLAPARSVSQIIYHYSFPFLTTLSQNGITFDRCDKRLFWLVGGKNSWCMPNLDVFFDNPPALLSTINSPALAPAPLTSTIPAPGSYCSEFQKVLTKLADAGIKLVPGSNRVYLGFVVPVLRKLGYNVQTKSAMSGNGNVNAIFNVGVYELSLFSFSDGHVIFTISDLDAFLKG